MRTPGSGLRHAGRIFGSGRSQTPDIQDIAGAGLIAIAAAEAVIAGVQQQIAAGGDRTDRVDRAAVPGRAIDAGDRDVAVVGPAFGAVLGLEGLKLAIE